MRHLVVLLVMLLGTSLQAGNTDGGFVALASSEQLTTARTPSRAETQTAADRLSASAARLKAVARAAESQPESLTTARELQTGIAGVEADYEYLIGLFSALNSQDHAKQLELMKKNLEFLKKQKQALMDRLAKKEAEKGKEPKPAQSPVAKMAPSSGSPADWQRLVRELSDSADRAAGSAAPHRSNAVESKPPR